MVLANISLPHSLSPTARIGLQEKNFSMNNSVWKNPKMASHIGIDVSHCKNSKLYLDMAQNTRDWIEIDKEFKAKKPKF